jgi:hypothetical protein
LIAKRYGTDAPGPDWAAPLRCSKGDSREVDFAVTGFYPRYIVEWWLADAASFACWWYGNNV